MKDNRNTDNAVFFRAARPVWLTGREDEPNTRLVLSCTLPERQGLTLTLTGFTSYRVFAGGRFLHYGPARTAGGYARADELSLPAGGELIIDAAGYRCFSLSTVNQPSFLWAEVRDGDGNVLAATGAEGFASYAPSTRVQKVMRFSRQRHYSEVWDYRQGFRPYAPEDAAPVSVLDLPLTLLPRRAPYADISRAEPGACVCAGTYTRHPERQVKAAPYNDSETKTQGPDVWGGWPYEELPYLPFQEIQRCDTVPDRADVPFPLTLKEGEFASVCLPWVEAGFIAPDMTALEGEADVIVAFNELCDPGHFVIPRITCVNAVEYLLPAGERVRDMSAEPYTARVITVLVRRGTIRLDALGMVRFRRDDRDFARVRHNDPVLDGIEEAALRSFSHNALDIYMDCPSRERAGWLCDSYYTGQVEYMLTGRTDTEDAFIENYLLRDNDLENRTQPYGRKMPEGMLPMCYPSDISGSLFMPQWAMWFVLEARMYLEVRRPDAPAALRERLREKVLGLCGFFRQYENADGLLERLPGHQFIEWSAANKWGQDINYPTNFLYAEMLECAGKMFDLPDLKEKAERLRRVTAEKSFNGTYFVDHAVYGTDGVARNAPDISEACQYYAVRFGHVDLTEERCAVLRESIRTKFIPGRPREVLPEVEPADALMGIYLRMELMSSGTPEERAQITGEIRDYFGERARKTGTLWEYRDHKGSLDHGFASFAALCLRRATGKL